MDTNNNLEENKVTKNGSNNNNNIAIDNCILIKLSLSIILLFIVSFKYQQFSIFLFGLLEIAIIFAINILNNKNNCKVKNIIVSSLLFILYLQCLVYYFGGSFVSLDMIANLSMIEDLGNNVYIYFVCLIIVLFISFINIKKKIIYETRISKETNKLIVVSLSFFVIVYSFFTLVDYNVYENSPIFSTENVIKSLIQDGYYETKYKNEVINELRDEFYKETSGDYVKKLEGLSDKPNIILIFAEGISTNIIEDNRNIMPNASLLLDESLYFDNYYNHTFATYYGLSGQLYSGYQKSNFDSNSLISLQSILKDNGYYTEFINPEPYNEDFTDFLNRFEFDNVYSVNTNDGVDLVNNTSVGTDENAFECLINETIKLSKNNQPYFICLYTFGTHVNMKNQNKVFGDGRLVTLNRFYNCDYFFGKFYDEFKNNISYDDTLLVFTGDHAAYADLDFKEAFPEYERKATACDEMPLAFFYNGINPKRVDVGGRNSLDLSPTILDCLDMEDDNYFLGNSLFGDSTKFDYIFESNGQYFTTKNSTISKLNNDDYFKDIKIDLVRYNSLKMGDISSLIEAGSNEPVSIYAEDGIVHVNTYIEDDYENISVAFWLNDGDQSDLEWKIQVKGENNETDFGFDLDDHEIGQEYAVHIYGNDDEGQHLLYPEVYAREE